MGLTAACCAQLGTVLPSLHLRDRLLTARVVPEERATTAVTTVQPRVEAASMRGHLGRTAVCHPVDGVANCARLVPSSRLTPPFVLSAGPRAISVRNPQATAISVYPRTSSPLAHLLCDA